MRRFTRRRAIFALVIIVCGTKLLFASLESNDKHDDLLEGRRQGSVSAGRPTAASKHKQDNGTSHRGNEQTTTLQDKHTTNKDTTNSSQSDQTNNTTSYNINDVIANLTKPWISNKTHRAEIWSKLNGMMDGGKLAVLTKRFTNAGKNLTFAINTQISHNVTEEIYQMLPKESPFVNLKSRRCSVVGNGGILKSSHCGPQIDKSDFVFRCNVPPLKGYKQHTGTKTNLTSINPGGVIETRYRRLQSIASRTKFQRDMKAYGDLLLPVYGINLFAYKTSLLALQLLRQKGSSTRALIINPDHFRALQDTWKDLGLKNRMTSGFYLVSVALSVCNSLDLYGFWPFDQGIDHRPVTYHYYDKMNISKGVHNFNWEFDVLYRLHMNGVLRMHIGPCK